MIQFLMDAFLVCVTLYVAWFFIPDNRKPGARSAGTSPATPTVRNSTQSPIHRRSA